MLKLYFVVIKFSLCHSNVKGSFIWYVGRLNYLYS
jgi:hypothetical protein